MNDKNNWGASLHNLNMNIKQDLEGSIRCLPATAKQAFYSAAMRKGIIHRGTWDGCAFNAGGMEIGNGTISSFGAAAKAFGCTESVVKRFINAWDSSSYQSDALATKALVELLEKVGIFSEPDRPTVRVYKMKVYEGNMTEAEMLVDFQKQIADIDNVIDGWAEAHELLFKETVGSCA